MKLKVDSPKGKQVYSYRMSVVEPVFGNIGTNKRLNQFSLRGKQKVQGQWRLKKPKTAKTGTDLFKYMRHPASTDHRKGKGRQVSFIVKRRKQPPRYTEWMKLKVDSPKGKQVYSYRMSVVEPVFGNIVSSDIGKWRLFRILCQRKNTRSIRSQIECSIKPAFKEDGQLR